MSDDASIEAVKAELILAQTIMLPQVASGAIDLGEQCDMLRGKLEKLSATSSNAGLERAQAHLNAAYELFVDAMEQVAEAKGAVIDALALM